MDPRETLWQSVKDAKHMPFSVSHNGLRYDFMLAFAPSAHANLRQLAYHLQFIRETVRRGCNPEAYLYGTDWDIVGKIVSKEISVA